MFHVARISTNIGVIFGINVGNYLRTNLWILTRKLSFTTPFFAEFVPAIVDMLVFYGILLAPHM